MTLPNGMFVMLNTIIYNLQSTEYSTIFLLTTGMHQTTTHGNTYLLTANGNISARNREKKLLFIL